MEESKNPETLTAEALAEKQRQLDEREQELNEKESALHKVEDRLTKAKYNLYDRIDVSLGTMNKVVAIIAIALVIALIVGMIYR